MFFDIVDHLLPGDLLVLNDTKVLPANLTGVKEGGSAKIEVLLAKRIEPEGSSWECLVKPGKRLTVGSRVIFGNNELVGKVLEKLEGGEQIIEFMGDVFGFMKEHGEVPLPPYIKRVNSPPQSPSLIKRGGSPKGGGELKDRYQTIYAINEGASAAPTAGLHFTPELLKKLKDKGADLAYITLHTGLATFKPVYAEKIEDHKMFSEYYEVPAETVAAIKKAKRVIAVGTTTVRTLESINELETNKRMKMENGKIVGETDMFIYPGYEFKVVDAMITNFHFPKSTLLMLVSAFAGKEFIFRAYNEAMERGYRFFSFGDAMLIK